MNLTTSEENVEMNYTYCGEELYRIQEAYAEIHGYVSLTVCYFGCVANVLNIAVLSRKEMRSPTNAILTGLAIADLLVMLDYIPYACHTHLSPQTRHVSNKFSYGWTTFVLFHSLFSQVCHTIAICLTVLLAVWRYIAVAYPQRNRDWCKMDNTLIALIMAYVLCPIICIPLYLAVGVHSRMEYVDSLGQKVKLSDLDEANMTHYTNITLYFVDFNEWALNNEQQFKKVNFWIYGVVIKLIPCIALTILSMRLIFALLETKRRRQNLLKSSVPLTSTTISVEENGTSIVDATVSKITRKQKKTLKMIDKEKQTDRTTRMLLAVLLLFLLTEFPQGILGLLSAVLGEPFFKQCYIPLGDIMDIIALINSAINFILYCSMSRQFRTTFRTVFRPRILNRWIPVTTQTPPEPNGFSTQVTQKRVQELQQSRNRVGV